MLELAGCANMSSDFSLADRLASESIRQSGLHAFNVLHMRGMGIRAGVFTKRGDWQEAWTMDLDGLTQFWSAAYPPSRAYQFYYDMSISAEEHGAEHVARALAAEAAIQIAAAGNVSVEALAQRTHLGRA